MNAENGAMRGVLTARHSELCGRKWLGYTEEQELEWIESVLRSPAQPEAAFAGHTASYHHANSPTGQRYTIAHGYACSSHS